MHIAFMMNLWIEHLGIMQVMSSLVERGHEVSVHISTRPKALLKTICRIQPEIIAFSLTTNNYHWAIELASEVRKVQPRIRIVSGGPHPTLFPGFCEGSEIDAVCVGEGDEACGDWLDEIQAGLTGEGVPNIWLNADGPSQYPSLRPLIDPLDNIPFALRDEFYRYKYFRDSPFKSFLATRGCLYSCRYCYNSRFRQIFKDIGKYRRLMSPERVVEEVSLVCRSYPTRLVIFEDDIFPHEVHWLNDFVPLYRNRVSLPFLINARANLLNEENVRLYKEAGVRAIAFGVETGCEQRRLEQLGTGLSDSVLVDAADLLHKHGIPFLTYNMVGLPGETAEDVYQTILLNRKISADYSRFVMYQPYPGLPLTEEIGFHDHHRDDISTVYYSYALDKRQNRNVINMQNFANWMVHHDRWDKLFLHLSRLPPNPLYKIFFWGTFFKSFRKRLTMRWKELLFMVSQNLR
jgi:radical SAM superfamily enzyme YgiQ (UPF0313 family)